MHDTHLLLHPHLLIRLDYSLMEDKKVSLISTWKQHEKDLKNLESALSTLNEYIGKGAAESMQSHIQEEAREDDKTQSKKDQSL